MKEYGTAIYIGRFQVFHNAHLTVLKQALEVAEEVFVVLGSHKTPSNLKNPFSAEQRKAMIESNFDIETRCRLRFIFVRDYFYNDNVWITEIQQKVNEQLQRITNDGPVALIGSYKDHSSSYLNMFPQWDFIPAKMHKMLNAADVRTKLFEGDLTWKDDVPSGTRLWLEENYLKVPAAWSDKVVDKTTPFQNHKQEYDFVKKYKESWKAAPYEPTFVTVDAVVVQCGHVLVIRRKFNPGKGCLALPGGFIKANERIEDAAFRELKEETGIKLAAPILRSSLVDKHVFDYPERSLRGRTITHAHYIKLQGKDLPEVKASDDASGAFWMPLRELGEREEEFFEDHFSIINYFIQRS